MDLLSALAGPTGLLHVQCFTHTHIELLHFSVSFITFRYRKPYRSQVDQQQALSFVSVCRLVIPPYRPYIGSRNFQ